MVAYTLATVLDAQTEKTIAQVTEQARDLFGSELVSITLYGSAAGEDFVPGRSDLNFAFVFEHIEVKHLQRLQEPLQRWHALGVATPLLLDRRSLDRGRDVFPMEFHDIQAQHRTLYGEAVFAGLVIDRRHLRYQAEHEVRGKLLRLRALYAEVGADRKRLEALLLDSVKTFLIVMRNYLRVRHADGATRYLAVLDQFEQHFHEAFPTIRQLARIRLGLDAWSGDITPIVESYLGEVERLVDFVDRIAPESGAPAA